MSEINVAYTRVFYENFNAKEKIVVNVGGARSTKSYSILQLFAYKMLTESNKIFLIARKNFPSLKRTAYRDFIEILKTWNIYDKNNHSKEQGNHCYFYKTNVVYFISIDDPSKMRSFKCNYVFFEEANDFEFEDFFQVFLRMNNRTKVVKSVVIAEENLQKGDTVVVRNGKARKKKLSNAYAQHDAKKNDKVTIKTIAEPNQFFMALNPDEEHNYIWDIIIEKFPSLPENPVSVKVIHSTYKDNPFLDDAYIASLEATKHFNPDYYEIYALGNRRKLKGIIHPDYELSNEEMPDDSFFDSIAYGVDFGGSAPSAVLKLGFKQTEGKTKVFIDEVLYQSYIRTSEIIDKIKSSFTKKTKDAPVYCDSASPERIAELQLAGINALPATDIKRSITFGWDIVNDHHLVITANAVNTAAEIKRYARRKNKNGEYIDEEIPGVPNHAMAALRYGIGQHRHEVYLRSKQIVSIDARKIITDKMKKALSKPKRHSSTDSIASLDKEENFIQSISEQESISKKETTKGIATKTIGHIKILENPSSETKKPILKES